MVKKNIKNNTKIQKKVVLTRKKKQKQILNKTSKKTTKQTKANSSSTKKQPKKKNIPKKSTQNNNNNNNNIQNEPSSKTEKIIIKSGAAVDKHVVNSSDYHVYLDPTTNKSYSATLNKSSLEKNNNKYYIIQLLQKDSSPETFLFYCRWGRIGLIRGQINETFFSAQEGIKQFQKKYNDKIKVGYTELFIDYGNDESNNKKKINKKNIKSSFSEKIIEFIKLIYNKTLSIKILKKWAMILHECLWEN